MISKWARGGEANDENRRTIKKIKQKERKAAIFGLGFVSAMLLSALANVVIDVMNTPWKRAGNPASEMNISKLNYISGSA